MSVWFVVARLIHISTAVFWGGAVFFINLLLAPSVMTVGPDGSKVMRELIRRRYFEIVVGAATLTVASGLYMMWVDSAGFSAAWFGTKFGRGISTGMLAAVIAYVLGAFIVRPALHRMLALGGQMAQASAGDRPAIQQQMNGVRSRLAVVGAASMVFLLLAILAMAVSRYL